MNPSEHSCNLTEAEKCVVLRFPEMSRVFPSHIFLGFGAEPGLKFSKSSAGYMFVVFAVMVLYLDTITRPVH